MKVATYFQKFEKNQNKGKIRENDPVYNFDFTRKITFQKHAEIQNVGKNSWNTWIFKVIQALSRVFYDSFFKFDKFVNFLS